MSFFAIAIRLILSATVVLAILTLMLVLNTIEASREKKSRGIQIKLLLPNVIEIIALYLAVGLPAIEGIRRSAVFVPEPLKSELSLIVGNTSIGMPISEAMEYFVSRTGCQDGKTLALVLQQAERFGNESVEKLQQLASSLRESRISELERLTKTAPIKMLIPLVILIFPALLIVLFAPVIIRSGMVSPGQLW